MIDSDRPTVQPPAEDSKAQFRIITYGCLGIFLSQAAYFIYLPSVLQLSTDFGVDGATVQNSIALYALGYGFSQLLWGPASDQMGRKPVALAGMGVFMLASLALVFPTTYGWFQALRLVQGIGGGCGTSVSRAALRDRFSAAKLSYALSYLGLAYAVALGGAPFLGGQLARWLSWRADFVVLAVLGLFAWLYLAYQLPETNPVDPLARPPVFRLSLIKNYLGILFNVQFLLPILTCTLATGMVVLYDAVSPFDVEKSLGLTPAQFGNTSLAITLAYLVGSFLVNRGVTVLGQKTLLYLGLCLVLSASSIMVALGLAGIFNVYSLLLPMVFVVVGCSIIILICMALSLTPFAEQAGLASALAGVVQQEGSGLIIALSVYLPTTAQTPLALTLLGTGFVLVILVKFLRV